LIQVLTLYLWLLTRYDYRTADALIADFELMKMNAVKFNGPESQIAREAVAIYDFVKDQVEASRKELASLEEAVSDIMDGKPKKKKNKTAGKNKKKSGKGTNSSPNRFTVNFGDLPAQFNTAGSDSGSDDSLDL
jgi:transcription initiation factor TFIID subunit 1